MKTQKQCFKEMFELVKYDCEIKKLPCNIKKYTFYLNGWVYDFYTVDEWLRKVEATDHRQLIEILYTKEEN